MFFREQPISIEAGNNEHKHKNSKINGKQQKNCLICKGKISNTTKGNEMKKVQIQQQKKCRTKIKRKTPEHRFSYKNVLICQAKRCPSIKLIFFCAA